MLKREMLIVFVLVLMMSACSGPAKPVASHTNTGNSDGGTVYDGSTETRREPEITQEKIEAEASIYEEQLDTLDSDGTRDRPLSDLNWEPVYFEFDRATLTEEGRLNLGDYARVLRENPSYKVLLEGHCDSRGTEDYNLALGERRAQTVMQYLLELGVGGQALKTISYGELRPIDQGNNEQAWQRNRRVGFTFPASANN